MNPKQRKTALLGFLLVTLGISDIAAVNALPPADDLPEEVLRTEIITGARSPLDGKPLTAAEYAELQRQLQTLPPEALPPVPDRYRNLITLLRLRKFIKTVFPFIPLR
jgi:hypothetical protein